MSMISEQIEELRVMAEMFVNGEPYGNLLRRAANTIEMLSEKAREPKQGEWIYWGKCVFPYECTQCHDKAREDYDFCPYCGARMVKGADDELQEKN